MDYASVFVAYADTDVSDLGTGMQSAAMVFQPIGGQWKLATAVTHPAGPGWPAPCTQGAPPATPEHLPTSSLPTLRGSGGGTGRVDRGHR
jgi:hypothetical protein